MNRMESSMSFLDRRNFFGALAGALAFIAGSRSCIGGEVVYEAAGTGSSKEFEILNGWVLRRQDIVGRK